MTDERDELIERVRGALAPLPAVPPASIAKVLAATANRRPPSAWARLAERLWVPRLSVVAAGAFAALALVAGFAMRGAFRTRGDATAVATNATATPDGSAAAGARGAPTLAASGAAGRVAVQFVLDAPAASSVAVVGDFNDWQPTAAPMQRVEAGQPWSAVVFVPPGRHVYAFLVNGTEWRADPRAPRADDADFGKPGSVLVVQVP